MEQEYRIMAIEPHAGASQVDLVFPSAYYTLKRVRDGKRFKVRMVQDPAWLNGEIVRLEEYRILAALV